jgi:hypothetical protein
VSKQLQRDESHLLHVGEMLRTSDSNEAFSENGTVKAPSGIGDASPLPLQHQFHPYCSLVKEGTVSAEKKRGGKIEKRTLRLPVPHTNDPELVTEEGQRPRRSVEVRTMLRSDGASVAELVDEDGDEEDCDEADDEGGRSEGAGEAVEHL